MQKKTMVELERKTVAEFRHSDKRQLVVVLDQLRSMHNVGSVFRTADAFLIESVYLCGYTPRPPHRDIHKTALGATETVSWRGFTTTLEAIEELKAAGYAIWAVEQVKGSVPLHEFDFSGEEKLAVIFGNEVEGVSADILDQCQGCVEIPQQGMKHSLNISVAAGIVLWELTRKKLA
jgi:tRNA G18 (ribose-2'-O)-methylase SpoU